MSGLRLLAATFAGAGIIAMVTLTHGAAWPLGLGWAGAALAIGLLVRIVTAWLALVAFACALVLAAFVFTWEGGLFMLPAATCLLVDSLARSAHAHG